MNGGDLLKGKDLGIWLFGRKIPVPETQIPAMFDASCQILPNPKLMDCCSEVQKVEAEGPRAKADKLDEDQVKITNADQDRVFKKPDKVVPCPRCNSLDTKFCYFNNYNVNQPRHFCKNCHRYWTAGGAMRNVPVGAGRRKNRLLASQFQQIILSSNGVPTTRTEIPFTRHRENGEEPSLCTSSWTPSSIHEIETETGNPGFPRSCNDSSMQHPLHQYPVKPWLSHIYSMPVVAVPDYYPPSSIPLQTVPALHLGRMPFWTAPSTGCLSPLSSAGTTCSGNDSTSLGKHSRDSDFTDKYILAPKTLRIGDPNEAARSPIWVSLGIKPDHKELITQGTVPKTEASTHPSDPAAHCRSQAFHHNT